jgi:hypothetical protein
VSKVDSRLSSELYVTIFLTVVLSTAASVGIEESTCASRLLSLEIFFMRANARRVSRFVIFPWYGSGRGLERLAVVTLLHGAAWISFSWIGTGGATRRLAGSTS